MKELFKVKLWGTRGSLPSPVMPQDCDKILVELLTGFAAFLGQQAGGDQPQPPTPQTLAAAYLKQCPQPIATYGGHTTCVAISTDQDQFIIDCGSGLMNLGNELMATELGKGTGSCHIFQTHFHWDHTIGLPFFAPIYIPGNKIHFHAVQEELPTVIKTLFSKPMFPVPFDFLASDISFNRLTARADHHHGPFTITPYRLDHPDPCYGYRIAMADKAVAHCVDTEAIRMSQEDLGADLPLYQNLDLMIFDAQYSLDEAIEKANWGHANAFIGIDIAIREAIPNVLFVHHDPNASLAKTRHMEQTTLQYYQLQCETRQRLGKATPPINIRFAVDGTEVGIFPDKVVITS